MLPTEPSLMMPPVAPPTRPRALRPEEQIALLDGLPVTFEDGTIEYPDGVIEPPPQGGGMGMGAAPPPMLPPTAPVAPPMGPPPMPAAPPPVLGAPTPRMGTQLEGPQFDRFFAATMPGQEPAAIGNPMQEGGFPDPFAMEDALPETRPMLRAQPGPAMGPMPREGGGRPMLPRQRRTSVLPRRP